MRAGLDQRQAAEAVGQRLCRAAQALFGPGGLGERLRALGIRAMPGRRAALIDLAAQLPAAVLADCLNLSPGTAVRWMHQAGADWNRYAADIARSRDHQP